MDFKKETSAWFKSLQDDICNTLAQADGVGNFKEDLWERPGGGGGRARVIEGGKAIEKGGVNFSAVYGNLPPEAAKQLGAADGETEFYATGISIVIHPAHPRIPIIHMNTRYFEMADGTHWFGGGIDLTPHYVNETEARFFHAKLKAVCDAHNPEYYAKFKTWADDYFYIPHRSEMRGIGGVFFDKMVGKDEEEKISMFNFVKDIGSIFTSIYTELIKNNIERPILEQELEWQAIRRSRYVEFNLTYDKGTHFGFKTGGRTESILMSMPPIAKWPYNYQPIRDSEEERTLTFLKKGINWTD